MFSRTSNNVRLGLVCGLAFGALYSAWAFLIFLIRGNAVFAPSGLTVASAMAAYLLAGTLGGLIIGLGLHVARKHLLGAALVGFGAAFTGWFVIGWSVDPRPLIQIFKTSALLGLAFGAPIGIGFWFQAKRYLRTGKWS